MLKIKILLLATLLMNFNSSYASNFPQPNLTQVTVPLEELLLQTCTNFTLYLNPYVCINNMYRCMATPMDDRKENFDDKELVRRYFKCLNQIW